MLWLTIPFISRISLCSLHRLEDSAMRRTSRFCYERCPSRVMFSLGPLDWTGCGIANSININNRNERKTTKLGPSRPESEPYRGGRRRELEVEALEGDLVTCELRVPYGPWIMSVFDYCVSVSHRSVIESSGSLNLLGNERGEKKQRLNSISLEVRLADRGFQVELEYGIWWYLGRTYEQHE